MDLEQFIVDRPYLYHLTSKENFDLIKKDRILYSANKLFKFCNLDPLQYRIKRKKHLYIEKKGKKIMIRDQRPLSEIALAKCLEDGWLCKDYYYYLNDRVFFWPTLERLNPHFNRYEDEKPLIIRLNTRDVITLNKNVKFSRLNSGATRPNAYLGGIAPKRGKNTFVVAPSFQFPIRKVAEVTFDVKCVLPQKVMYSSSPVGSWKNV